MSKFVLWTVLTLTIPVRTLAAEFELLHLWTVPAEINALSALSEPVKAQGVKWSEQTVQTNFDGIRNVFADRLAVNAAPDGVFWIGGAQVNRLIRQKIFVDIPAQHIHEGFIDHLIPEISKEVLHDDRLNVLPLGIHLQNEAIYNTAILEKLNLVQPQSWADLIEIAPVLKENGYFTISVSDQRWQLRFLFGAIIASHFTADEYRNLISGQVDKSTYHEKFVAALDILAALKPFANNDSENLNWEASLNHVVQGRALVNVLGDFTSPIFEGNDGIICDLPPGNTFIQWSFDTIALTNQGSDDLTKGQRVAAYELTSPEAQQAYIKRKGGLPVLDNIPDNILTPCSQIGARNWRKYDDHVLLSYDKWSKGLNIIASSVQLAWLDGFPSNNRTADEIIEGLSQLTK